MIKWQRRINHIFDTPNKLLHEIKIDFDQI